MAIETLGSYHVTIRKDTSTKNLYYFEVTTVVPEEGNPGRAVNVSSGQTLGIGQAMMNASDRAFEALQNEGKIK